MGAPDNVVPLAQEQAARDAVRRLYAERVQDGRYLDNSEFPELQYAVEGLIPEGYSLLVGSPKVGKSWLVGNICVNVARGGNVLGVIPVTKRPVMLFALEDSDRRLQKRFRRIAGDGNAIPEDLHRVLKVNHLNEALVIAEEFQDRCEADGDESPLIVIDTLGRIQPDKRAGQSAFQADYELGSRLQNLAKRLEGTSVVAIHHDNKGTHDDFISGASGTQGVTAACDAILVLKRDRESIEATLEITGRDVNETSYALQTDMGLWSMQGTRMEHSHELAVQIKQKRAEEKRGRQYGDKLNEVSTVLKDSGAVMTPNEVAKLLGIPAPQAGTYLGRAVDAGLAERVSRGKYRSTLTD